MWLWGGSLFWKLCFFYSIFILIGITGSWSFDWSYICYFTTVAVSCNRKRDTVSHFLTLRFFLEDIPSFSTFKTLRSLIPNHSLSTLNIMSDFSVRYFFSPICSHGVSSKKSRRTARFRVHLFARSLVRNMAVTSSGKIVPALVALAPLNSSLTAQTECVLEPRFVQNSNKLAVFDNSFS